MARALEDLLHARQECKKLELMRKKRHGAWMVRKLKLAQKEADDRASRQTHRCSGVQIARSGGKADRKCSTRHLSRNT